MSGQYPQEWPQPQSGGADPYGYQPTQPIQPTDPYGYQPTQPLQPTDPYGQQWAAPAPQQSGYAPAPGYAVAPAYAPAPYVLAPAAPRTNTLALVGFILALVGVPVAPIIMGHIARKQIRTSGEGGDGLALAAIIIGYVVAGILAAVIVFYIVMLFIMFATFGAFASTGY